MDNGRGRWWVPVVTLKPSAVSRAVVRSPNLPFLRFPSGRALEELVLIMDGELHLHMAQGGLCGTYSRAPLRSIFKKRMLSSHREYG